MTVNCACGQPHRFSDVPNQRPKNYDCAFCGDTFDAAKGEFEGVRKTKSGAVNNDVPFDGSAPDIDLKASKTAKSDTTAKGGEGG